MMLKVPLEDGLSSLAILVLPMASLLQIVCSYSTGRSDAPLRTWWCESADTKDVDVYVRNSHPATALVSTRYSPTT
jgi:hypothetical protein